ncbi:MAG: fatty acyl-AMP ligase [Legionella sp.]|nr:MAG: fatty acyl-AMP ligase [Legionella sp.]
MEKDLFNAASLVEVLRFRALTTPNQTAYIFLNRELEEPLTYAMLDQQARTIAVALQAQGLKTGDRVLLLFSPGLNLIEAFFGCLYAGCIAVPIYPPGQDKLMDKALRIIANSTPKLTLMTADHLAKFTTPDANNNSCFENIPALAVDELENKSLTQWQSVMPKAQDLAFLQYTSGSTMHPKGVIVSHLSLMDNLKKISHQFGINSESILFSWLPPHHDMGLIGYILTPLYCGRPVIMMSPFSFLQNPLSWLKNISKYRVTISGSPNFAYDYCVKRIKEEKKEGLDLSCWQVASNGAEPLRAETMEHFTRAFQKYGFNHQAFYPCYGLAEATLLVSGSVPGQGYKTVTLTKEKFQDHNVHFAPENSPNSYRLVSSGQMAQDVKIVDPETLSICQPDQIGEIWVHSPSVTQGYWEQPQETQEAFHGQITGDQSKTPYLRTGDLGFVHDNELYVTGRIKDLIILYGKNHYPQDIEYTILHAPFYPQLGGKCAAFVMQQDEEYKLAVMCEVKNRFLEASEQEQLFNAIFNQVYQAHQLEIHEIILVALKSMPQTTSGKIRRNFCRQHLLDNTLPVVGRWQLQKE